MVATARSRGAITRASIALIAATVMSLTLIATLAKPAAATTPIYFDPGASTADWGISERFRCYVTGTIARGWIETTGPVTRLAGTTPTGGLCQGTNPANGQPWGSGGEAFRFGLAAPAFAGAEPVSQIYDPGTGVLRIDLGGTVRFLGHDYHTPGNTTPQLNTLLENLRIEANLQTGEGLIYTDSTGATMDSPTAQTLKNVRLATFDATSLNLSPVGGKVTAAAVPTTLHADGVRVFGSYLAGDPMDPLSFSLTVGPKPDPRSSSPGPTRPGATPDPASKPQVKVRPARRLGARTVLAVIACPRAASGGCRIAAPKRLRLKTKGSLNRADRQQLRRGARIVAPKRIASGRRAQILLRVSAGQRKALKNRRVQGNLRLRVRAVGEPTVQRVLKVVARVR